MLTCIIGSSFKNIIASKIDKGHIIEVNFNIEHGELQSRSLVVVGCYYLSTGGRTPTSQALCSLANMSALEPLSQTRTEADQAQDVSQVQSGADPSLRCCSRQLS